MYKSILNKNFSHFVDYTGMTGLQTTDNVVKLQAKSCLGVDFVFPLSNQLEKQQQEEQEPSPKSTRRGCTRSPKFDT